MKKRDKSSWSARRVFCQQQSTFTRMRRFTHWQHGVGLPLFAGIFRRKTEINHGVENLAKYVITCGNWGHKWRRWKYLSLIVIISDRAMGCHYFLAYHIFMWVSIYSVLSGLWDYLNVKSHPSLSLWYPPPSKHTHCLIVPPIHTNAQIAFTHNHIEWKKDQSFSPSTATGGEKTLLLLWIKNNNPNQQ